MVQLFRRAVLARFLEEGKRGGPGFVVDHRLHILGVEEKALAGAVGLNERGRDRHDRVEALCVPLLEHAGPKIALAVAVHVLAVGRGGHLKVLVPGLGRLQSELGENVAAVIEHLEVAIDGDQLSLAIDLLVEFPEVGRDVVDVQVRIVGYKVGKVRQKTAGREFNRPAGRKHADIDRICARRPVGEQFLE